jgi:acetate kinase
VKFAERDRHVLSIDCGSSSLKAAVYECGPNGERRLLEGGIERLGEAAGKLHVYDYRSSEPREIYKALVDATPIAAMLALLVEFDISVEGVGHRLVYGGSEYIAPAFVTADLIASLTRLVPVEPLHMPAALAAIREIQEALPLVPQVVCFDTAFHAPMPSLAKRLPLPRELRSDGIRRYGFHGLSYESIVDALGAAGSRGRMLVAHLGSGASLAAMRDGQPVDTTMGFTTLGGLVMGTRPGDLDPGVLLYLLRAHRYTIGELDRVLTNRSGLLGVSQTSADMLSLLDARADDPRAAEAVDLFVYQAKKHIGALVAVLGGLDTLVFTGGIGEHSAPVRSEIAAGLGHLGVVIDAARNDAGAPVISVAGGPVIVRVVPANENLMIVRHTNVLLSDHLS